MTFCSHSLCSTLLSSQFSCRAGTTLSLHPTLTSTTSVRTFASVAVTSVHGTIRTRIYRAISPIRIFWIWSRIRIRLRMWRMRCRRVKYSHSTHLLYLLLFSHPYVCAVFFWGVCSTFSVHHLPPSLREYLDKKAADPDYDLKVREAAIKRMNVKDATHFADTTKLYKYHVERLKSVFPATS